MTVHRFAPPLPMRALVLGAALAVLGAVLAVVLVDGSGSGLWALPGGVLLAVGVALVLLAVVSTRRNAAVVELGDQGYRVSNRAGERRGDWSQVRRVKQSIEGDRLTFVDADGAEVHVVAPRGSITSLSAEVTARLNRSRGYGED